MKPQAWFFVSLAVSMSTALSATARATERADVPDQYKWNTADLYPTEDAWAKAKDSVAGRIPKLAEYQGQLGASAASFYTAVSALMDLDLELSHLATYASMRSDEDTRVSKTREMKQSADDLAVKFAAATAFIRPEILALGEAKVHGFVAADARLKPFAPWLDDILRYAPHTLSAAEEKVAAEAAIMADGGSNAYTTFTNADLPYPDAVLSTGEKIHLDASAYTRYRASAVRADRDLVFKTFWSRYKDFERTLGSTLDANVKTHVFDKNVHKYASCLEAALYNSNVPVTVYSQLVKDVHANLPTLHRYLKLRQKMMGVDQLRYEDLYAPIVGKAELNYTPEQAKDLVLKAVEPLGEQYVADLKKGFEQRWVDFMPTPGKKSGATRPGPTAYIPISCRITPASTRRSRPWPTRRAIPCIPSSRTRTNPTRPTTTRSSWPRWPRP